MNRVIYCIWVKPYTLCHWYFVQTTISYTIKYNLLIIRYGI